MKGDIEVNLSLHPGQRKVFDSAARFIVVVAGRRFGKSWLACVRAITSASAGPMITAVCPDRR